LRFSDGMIEREELIGEKTIERYINRDDKLMYQAVRFTEKNSEKQKDMYEFVDNNIGKVIIHKMVQKFEQNIH